jgi:methionine sulfoxide reductase heme-binding subunit
VNVLAIINPVDYGWWIAARAAGIIAIVLLSASVGLGLWMSSPGRRRAGMKVVLLRLHQYLAVAGLIAIASHGLFLLADGWLAPSLSGILVPFSLSYRPVWTGLGIIAAWGVALLGLSYWARKRIGVDRWKVMHRFTLLFYVLAMVHVLGSGTDSSSLWLRLLLLACVAPIPAFVVMRLLPLRKPPVRRAPPVAPAPAGSPPRPAAPAAATREYSHH